MPVVQLNYKLLKEKAINLRKQGLSYSEILKKVPVAKSTLSLWLRSVGLSKRQKQRLTERKLASIKRGWIKWHQQRIDLMNKIKNAAKSEVGGLSKRELWLVGVSLYWAEGTKEKKHNPGQNVCFSNSDPRMIKIFLKWLKEIIKIEESDIKYEIYIHENSKNNLKNVINYWTQITNSNPVNFKYIYFKKSKINTKRKNIGNKYYGLLRIIVRKSTNLNRKISGWIEGIHSIAG